MFIGRRTFLKTTGMGAASLWGGKIAWSKDGTVDEGELDDAASEPILRKELFAEPVVIRSIELLEKDGDHFIRVRSEDGAEGVSVTNGREYLHPILKQLVVPYFVSKDARELEEHLFGV
jgi:hypothetical protein